tara:strand:- start:2183 stop:3064 length:882 start_codon:yes stop_codon:yes gene_type:complete
MRPKIIICICTKNRKLKLIKLINSIKELTTRKTFNLELLIIANDKSSYQDIISKFKKVLKVEVFREHKKGLSHTRNKCLEILRKKNYTYATFFDDDCVLKKDWLLNMYKIFKKFHPDIIAGPQIAKSKNIFLTLMERHEKNLTNIKWASTNNVFFKKSAIKNKVTFSKKLNLIGGEDQLFFLKLNYLGKKIIWNNASIVYEAIDKKRENLKWFIKRNLRYGLSGIVIYQSLFGIIFGTIYLFLKIFNDFFQSLKNLFASFLFSKKHFYKFIMYFCRALGGILGIFGFQIKEYL